LYTLALGLWRYLLALALELLREEVVEDRPDHHDGRQKLHFFKGGRNRRAQDVGAELEFQA